MVISANHHYLSVSLTKNFSYQHTDKLIMANTNDEFVPTNEVQDVVDRILKQCAQLNASERLIVGIAGRPGSGKTNLADVIANTIRSNNDVGVAVMPMDGYHLYREELSRLPNPEYAFSRRGAHWTFNPEKLYNDLVRIRTGRGEDIRVPSFDHALKDPKENDILIPADAQIILVEGNYLFYTAQLAWKKVSEMFQFKIFLQCNPLECTERLIQRHMRSWNISREEASIHAKGSDFKNGNLIDTTIGNADVVCHSNDILLKTIT